jgi:tRNA/rRNA methyltransferase
MASFSCAIVLVRPRDPNNIGAAARAMKNFGLCDLVIVAPHPPIWEEARSAVGAEDVLASARVVETLVEAIADRTLVIGTADHTRFDKTQTPLTPLLLRCAISGSHKRIALVFGPEKTGLTNADLSFCHQVLSIPTKPDCPSMNLGQAVAICCYELMREESPGNLVEPAVSNAASAGKIEGALGQAAEILSAAGFFTGHNQQAMMEELRQSLLRLRLTRREVAILRGALRQIGWKLNDQAGEQ